MTKVFITGTTGYLGRNLLKLSKVKGINAVGVDRFCDGDGLTYEDFFASTDLEGASIIHCAGLAHAKGRSYADFYAVNVELTVRLARYALSKKIKKFIYISTIGVFGNEESYVDIYSLRNPYDNYTKSKCQAEKELNDIFVNCNTKLIVIRPPLIIGKKAPGNIALIENLLHFFPVTPFACLNNKRSIIKIETLCEIILNSKNQNYSLWLPAEERTFSTKEIFDLVAICNGKKFIHLPVPSFVLRKILETLGMDSLKRNLLADLVIKNAKVN